MKITDINITLPKTSGGRLLGYVTVVFDNSFLIRDLRIIENQKGIRIQMPDKKVKHACKHCGKQCEFDSKFCKHCGQPFSVENLENTFSDVCHPINKEFRFYLESEIMTKYDQIKNQNALSFTKENQNG